MGEKNYVRNKYDRLGTPMRVGIAALSSIFAYQLLEKTEYEPEKITKDAVAMGFETVGEDDPFEKDLNATPPPGGRIPLSEYLGQFTVYTNSSFNRVNKLFGVETDDIDIDRDGLLAGRLFVPDLAAVDTPPREDGGLHITLMDGGRDVGIDVSGAYYEMLRPETAPCLYGPEDPEFTGCLPGVDTDDGFLDRIPGIGANSDFLAADAAMNIFNEYGMLPDECFIEKIIIPELNSVYETYGYDRIDGENQADEAMKTMLRFQLRSRVSPGVHPSKVSVHLTGNWEPIPPLEQRVEGVLGAMGVADSIDSEDMDESEQFCLEKSEGYTDDFVYMQGFNEKDGRGVDWTRVALGGMKNPPADFNMETGEDTEGAK